MVILISFLILFLELSLIRFLPAHILYLGFFTNLVLIASFLGIGLGLFLSKSKKDLISYFPLLLFILIAASRIFSSGLSLDNDQVIFFHGFNDLKFFSMPQLPSFILLPAFFILTALVFMPLSQLLGKFFILSNKSLNTYILDILGSILGIIAFYILSLAGSVPAVWFGIITIIFSVVLLRQKKGLSVWLVFMIIAIVLSFDFGKNQNFWSPYYKLTLIRNESGGGKIFANNIEHQIFDQGSGTPYYQLTFSKISARKRLGDVLIIGAGNGQDTAFALQNGARSVTAVEIDPKIYYIGKTYHPRKPYDDPRVKVVIDDGRSFIRQTRDKYDVVIFALTDSLVLSSGIGDVRLESFLFTVESFSQVKKILKEDGIFVLYNDYRQDWLIERIGRMLTVSFKEEPEVFQPNKSDSVALFFAKNNSNLEIGSESSNLPTDDWPFLYLKQRQISQFYLSIILAVAAVCLSMVYFTARRSIFNQKINLPRLAIFFLLGCAFSLLETKSIANLSLAFGVTWIVNGLAFLGILIAVLLACLLVLRFKIKNQKLLFVLLIASVGMQYLVPNSFLLNFDFLQRLIVSLVFFYTPIFIANLLFAGFFSGSKNSSVEFGANILGLTFGGLLEYASLVLGYSSLAVIIAGIYFAAFLIFAFSSKIHEFRTFVIPCLTRNPYK